ncbi:MAG TPA: MraY family glycosyltransferase [Gaiellaceae bacterium]|nr:MraY family glycosyltransferase [Gaiellaceae bacterium]
MLHTFSGHLGILWGALIALAIVVLLTPAVGGMARLLGVVDRPGGRRVNKRAVPRLGGLALFLGFVVPALLFLDLNREARGLLVGAAVATVVGAVDDFRGLTWWEKLVGQVGAAVVPVAFGIWVTRFTFPVLGIHVLPKPVGMTVTVLGIVAIMNMLNFLDGLDGLAAGVSAIAGFTFCVIAISLGNAQTAIVSAIVFGACLGFLRHNFYPARIFMGDSGALLLGFVLATESVQGLLNTAALATLVLPLLVLAVPILDTSFVIAKRLKYRRPVWTGDRTHLHHRFVNIGFSQRRAVTYLYLWCGTLAGAALATRFLRPHRSGVWHVWPTLGAVVVGLAAVGASVYIAYLLEIVKLANPRVRRREDEARESPEHRRSA